MEEAISGQHGSDPPITLSNPTISHEPVKKFCQALMVASAIELATNNHEEILDLPKKVGVFASAAAPILP